MGQKVSPISLRLQVNKDWRSKWFAGKREYANYLAQDLAVRRMIQKNLGSRAAINKVDIERSPNLVTVTVTTAKAGVVIGRGGAGAQMSVFGLGVIVGCLWSDFRREAHSYYVFSTSSLQKQQF